MLPETSKTKHLKNKSLFLPKNSSFLNNLNLMNKNIQDIPKRYESLKMSKKAKYSYNENSNRGMNKTLSSNKFPLLLSKFKTIKNSSISNDEQRLINYKKMKRYRVKLIKVPPTQKKVDNVYKLFKDNGLQFLFPPEKKT